MVRRLGSFQYLGEAGDSLDTVTCPTESLCLTAGSIRDTQPRTVVYVSHDAGSHWQSVSIGQVDEINAIACVSSSRCRAMGHAIRNGTGGLPAIHDGGKTWTTTVISDPPALGGLRCAMNGPCRSKGLTTTNVVTAEPVIFIEDAAGHTSTHVVSSLGVAWLNGVSCGAPLFCGAVGYGYATSGDRTAAMVATFDGGKSWRQETLPANLEEVVTIACPATMRCVAAATTPQGYAILSRQP